MKKQRVIDEIEKHFPECSYKDELAEHIVKTNKNLDGSSESIRIAVRGSRLLVNRFFNIDLSFLQTPEEPTFFDTTTPVLKAFLDKEVEKGHKVLEIGTGHVAINSLYLVRKFGSEISQAAIERVPEFYKSAKKVAKMNRLKLNLYHSDFLENFPIKVKYDLVFFNPPYVPTAEIYDGAFRTGDGGRDGLDVVRQSLDILPEVLRSEGVYAMGINTKYQPDVKILELINQSNKFELREKFTYGPNKSIVYALKMTNYK